MKYCEIFTLHVNGRRAISFTHKKQKTREKNTFNSGNYKSVINNIISLLCINYSSLSMTSFCDFYSLEQMRCLQYSLLCADIFFQDEIITYFGK